MTADTVPLTLILPASFIGGLVLGYAYFLALRETARLIVAQGHPLIGLALTLGRLGLITAGLYLAVQAGALALLAALAGVLCAKAFMLRTSL
jgi:F1F0 ATPase subunit 2